MSQLDDFLQSLRNLDVNMFTVPSQTGPGDRKSLLTLQNIVRNIKERYVYLEIGSHLGGTLVPHLLDPQCRHVISVDLRPLSQPDERGVIYDYKENSTRGMIAALEPHVPASTFVKLMTIEADMSVVTQEQVPLAVDLALIDGEHTDVAVFRDFISMKKFMSRSCIVMFHDAHLLSDGLQNIESYLKESGVVFETFFMPDCLCAIVIGDYVPLASSMLRRNSFNRNEYINFARLELWRELAENFDLIRDNQIAHKVTLV